MLFRLPAVGLLPRLVFTQQAQHAPIDLLPQAVLDFGQNLVFQALQRNLGEVGAQAVEKLGAAFERADIAFGEQGLDYEYSFFLGFNKYLFKYSSKKLI